MEGGNIIGLLDVTGGGAISLEPGGQFELSGAPVETVHQMCRELRAHLAQVRQVARAARHRLSRHRHDAELVARRDADDAERPLPHHDRLHAEGGQARHRHDVPDLHGADQSRLLFRGRHGEEAARVAGAAAGRHRAVRQFAFHRRQAQRFSLFPIRDLARHRSGRSGMLPWAFEPGMGFERWVDYALDVPMYFVKRGEHYIDVAGQSFRDLHGGQTAGAAGRARHASRTGPITSRRFSRRCGSSATWRCAAPTAGPQRRLPALPAFWVGHSLRRRRARCRLGAGEALDARKSGRNCATTCPGSASRREIRGVTVLELARRDAGAGARRPRAARPQGPEGHDETQYLAPLEESVERGITPAEELLEKFHGPWNGSVEPIFDEYAY